MNLYELTLTHKGWLRKLKLIGADGDTTAKLQVAIRKLQTMVNDVKNAKATGKMVYRKAPIDQFLTAVEEHKDDLILRRTHAKMAECVSEDGAKTRQMVKSCAEATDKKATEEGDKTRNLIIAIATGQVLPITSS